MGPGTGVAHNLTNAGTNPGAGADITKGTHADNACSIVAYTGEKFYEYVAIAKMVYVLATDEDARKQLMAGISESGFGHLMSGYGYSEMAQSNFQLSAVEQILNWFGLGDKDKAEKYAKDGINMQLLSQSEYSKAAEAIAGYFSETWHAIEKRFTQCGWLYGIATLTVDGVFLVGDLALGEGISAGAKAMLKSIKVFVRVVKTEEEAGKASKVVVEFTHASGGKVEREFSVDQLERQFGKPEDHHPGVKTEEQNYDPKPEDGKKKLSTKAIGDAAEAQAEKDLKAQGYEQVYKIQDSSGHGVDLIGVDANGNVKALEIKANTANLSADQAEMGGQNYVASRLRTALQNPATRADAREALEAFENAPKTDYEIWKYDVDPVEGTVTNGRGAQWVSKEELTASGRKKRAFRKDMVTPQIPPTSVQTPSGAGPPQIH